MSASVLFQPTAAFEDAFHNENAKGALMVVLLTGLFTALAVYFISANIFTSAFTFLMNIIQWLVFAGFVWFFEFVHVRKKKHLVGVNFSQCLSVVGKLWTINLLAAIVFAFTSYFAPIASAGLVMFLGILLVLSSLILIVAWLIASFKMLKVVFGAEKLKLILNWIIINLLNGLVFGLVASVISSILF